MRMMAAAAVALAAIAALGQADAKRRPRPARGRADAGERPVLLGTDPPGRLRHSAAPDGGALVQQDAGPDLTQRELQELRGRIDALERERAQSQQQSQQLEQLTRELQALRQQVADAEARRAAGEQQQAARREQVQSAIDALYSAQQRLASGSAGIEAELAQAETVLSGQAQRDLQAARMALQNRDLSAARAYLSAAIADAQQGR